MGIMGFVSSQNCARAARVDCYKYMRELCSSECLKRRHPQGGIVRCTFVRFVPSNLLIRMIKLPAVFSALYARLLTLIAPFAESSEQYSRHRRTIIRTSNDFTMRSVDDAAQLPAELWLEEQEPSRWNCITYLYQANDVARRDPESNCL